MSTTELKTYYAFWNWALTEANKGYDTRWSLKSFTDGEFQLWSGTYSWDSTYITIPKPLGKSLLSKWTKDRYRHPNYGKSIIGISNILDPQDKHGIVKAYRAAQKRRDQEQKRNRTRSAFSSIRSAAARLSEQLAHYKSEVPGIDENTSIKDILELKEPE